MKNSNQQSLGEAIREFLEVHELSDKYLETEIYHRWEELAGSHINLKTKRVEFRKGVLTIFLNSSVLRNELSLRKTEFIKKLNDRLKGRPVHDLKFR